MAKQDNATTVLFNFDKGLIIKGDKMANNMFAVVVINSLDGEDDKSTNIEIVRSVNLREAKKFAKETFEFKNPFGFSTVDTILFIGKIS